MAIYSWGCLTITVIYQNRIFSFLIITVINAMPGEGLISDTSPTLVTTYWKRRFAVPASSPSLGSIGPVTKWNWPGYEPGTLHSIYSTTVGLWSLLLLPLLKKEIAAAAAGGWGVTKYLQLDWMDDGTDGWMESFTTSFNILYL